MCQLRSCQPAKNSSVATAAQPETRAGSIGGGLVQPPEYSHAQPPGYVPEPLPVLLWPHCYSDHASLNSARERTSAHAGKHTPSCSLCRHTLSVCKHYSISWAFIICQHYCELGHTLLLVELHPIEIDRCGLSLQLALEGVCLECQDKRERNFPPPLPLQIVCNNKENFKQKCGKILIRSLVHVNSRYQHVKEMKYSDSPNINGNEQQKSKFLWPHLAHKWWNTISTAAAGQQEVHVYFRVELEHEGECFWRVMLSLFLTT